MDTGEANVYDVIIVGGGPAGCASAMSFQRTNPNGSFLLIDNSNPEEFKIGESLPPEAKPILQNISRQATSNLDRDTASGIHLNVTGTASAWESEDLREYYALMNPFGMGWHLDRAAFDKSLRNAVGSICAVSSSRIMSVRFTGVRKEAGVWIISSEHLEVKYEHCAKWIIDATGRRASLARKLSAKTHKQDSLLAFYMLFETSSSSDSDYRTLIEAVEDGWWYTSQLSNNSRVVVYHTDDSEQSAKEARRRPGFLNLMRASTTHISQIIEECQYVPIKDSSFPRCTAACSSFLEPFLSTSDRWVAVGDAAIAFDPLSSQGMITALRMGSLVGKALGMESMDFTGSSKSTASDTIVESFLRVKDDYNKQKKHFYGTSRFNGSFWKARRS